MKRLQLLALCCILALEPVLGQMRPDTALLGKNTKVGHFAPVRGIRLYYESYGTGEPVLFIHGNGGSMRDFRHQVIAFAKSHKVVLVDSRAQGRSVDPGDSLSYEMMADDMDALLEHLKIDSCYVVGWSDGGITAILLALRHPKRVRKLAATGANLWPDSTALDPWMYRTIADWDNELAKTAADAARRNEKKLVHLMAVQPHIILRQLRDVRCPSLIIGGDNDVILPEHTMQIARAIPRSYLWILPNSGHSTLVHYSEEFNRVVMDFFKKPYRPIRNAAKLE